MPQNEKATRWGLSVQLHPETLLDAVTLSEGGDYSTKAVELGFNLNTGAYMYRYDQTLVPDENTYYICDKKLFKYDNETGIFTAPTLEEIERYVDACPDMQPVVFPEFRAILYFKSANAGSNLYTDVVISVNSSNQIEAQPINGIA